MSFSLTFRKHILHFNFPARTSRGAIKDHNAFILVLSSTNDNEIKGIGECAPLQGLSPEYENFEMTLAAYCEHFNSCQFKTIEACVEHWHLINKGELPALSFGLETAMLDYKNKGQRVLFETDFTRGKQAIPINGLIWMGDLDWMRNQVKQKLEAGFTCLKFKIGAQDFDEEIGLLKQLRKQYTAQELSIRVDANGAFSVKEASEKLQRLGELELHSIEQPIAPGNWDAMAKLCAETPLPIALDEELIGPQEENFKKRLLYFIKPQFIILKPTLVGGLASCREWIKWAEHHQVGWWLTSALESNIGLNAIAQFAATLEDPLPQGLGTGQLYTNNFLSPLAVEKGRLFHRPAQIWNLEPVLR